MTEPPICAYSGVDNLEIMDDAVNYNAFLLDLVTSRVRPDDAILDFGAGTGVLARPLAANGYRVSCVEPDPDLRARLTQAGLGVHAGLHEIPPESFDFIYTINVLEHIRDDDIIVGALRTRLKPGGVLLVYVPAFPLLYSSMDRKVGHVRRYRHGRLVGVLRAAGLQVEFISHQDCLGFFAGVLFKLISNDTGTFDRRALVAYDRYVFPLSRRLDRLAGMFFGKNLLAVGRRHAQRSCTLKTTGLTWSSISSGNAWVSALCSPQSYRHPWSIVIPRDRFSLFD